MSAEQLKIAYNRLQEKSRKQGVALASAAHELKTPLAIMAGYLELLLSQKLGPLSDKQIQVLQAMQSSSMRLRQFIQDFLTYCASESGNMAVQFEQGDLNGCLHEVYSIWLPRFEDQGIALYFPDSASLPVFPFDYHKVQRVVSNLLENAYLSTPAGGSVWLTAEPYYWERRTRQVANLPTDKRRNSIQKPNSVRVSIADTGPGIAPEFQQEIFDDFVSLRSSEAKNPGTGLGLAIARRLVQAQQGKMWVESEVGSGSKFCFVLPFIPYYSAERFDGSAENTGS